LICCIYKMFSIILIFSFSYFGFFFLFWFLVASCQFFLAVVTSVSFFQTQSQHRCLCWVRLGLVFLGSSRLWVRGLGFRVQGLGSVSVKKNQMCGRLNVLGNGFWVSHRGHIPMFGCVRGLVRGSVDRGHL